MELMEVRKWFYLACNAWQKAGFTIILEGAFTDTAWMSAGTVSLTWTLSKYLTCIYELFLCNLIWPFLIRMCCYIQWSLI